MQESRVGGVPNRMESPNTRVVNESAQVPKDRETKNLRKPVLTSKVVNPFTRALTPPFIGRRKDFYIPRLPSNLGNILRVNMYMNVFYIPWFADLTSYIYKSATSSHFKPRIFVETSLTWLPLNLRSFIHEIHQSSRFPNEGFSRFPNSAGSWFLDFR
jgi:hypothetical protein